MNKGQEKFVQELLQQMPELNSEQYTRYRRELDDKLAHARAEEKTMRRIVIGAWTLALALWAAVVLWSIHSGDPTGGKLPESVATVMLLVPITALLLLALYLFKYRRKVALFRVRTQEAALGELQRQLNELRTQILPGQTDKDKASPK
jgi:hypothetical protein